MSSLVYNIWSCLFSEFELTDLQVGKSSGMVFKLTSLDVTSMAATSVKAVKDAIIQWCLCFLKNIYIDW